MFDALSRDFPLGLPIYDTTEGWRLWSTVLWRQYWSLTRDDRGSGCQNCQKLRDVIYGRPPLDFLPGFFRVDDRNFRSHYYEKVGFRGMDERKTLEIILKDDPISLEKCVNFTLRCTIPAADRYIFIFLYNWSSRWTWVLPNSSAGHLFKRWWSLDDLYFPQTLCLEAIVGRRGSLPEQPERVHSMEGTDLSRLQTITQKFGQNWRELAAR